VTENLLYYLWKYRLAGHNHLLSSGEHAVIVDPGRQNHDSGPDFFNARIRIGETLWAGNVEIHVRASDWDRHGHHLDAAYDSIILHVVYMNDKAIRRRNGMEMPTLELEGKINWELLATYQQLMMNRSWIPCAHLVPYVGSFVVHGWLDRMVAERFDRKSEKLERMARKNVNNWNEVFYHALAGNFGFETNKLPFEMLARSLPLQVLYRHMDNLFQLEALLFGQAGMLAMRYRGSYFLSLKKEYAFLSAKYGLQPIDPHTWKLSRMRPANFPTVRIAQFSALLQGSAFLLSRILEAGTLRSVIRMLAVQASPFWDHHYSFGKRTPGKPKKLGDEAVKLILVNTVIPFIYVFGKVKGNTLLTARAFRFLEQLPGEDNKIIRGWRQLGIHARSAFTTQALIELKTRYCRRKRCLECGIGNSILRGAAGDPTSKIVH